MPDEFHYPSSEGETASVSESELPPDAARPKPPDAAVRPKRPRGPRNECKAWTFTSSMKCDRFTPDLSVEAKAKLIQDHVRTRLNHHLPKVVRALAIHVNSSYFSGPPGAVNVPFTGYIQTKNTTAIRLNEWVGCNCTPVPGGLYGNPEFLANIQKPAPWKLLPIISTLALNNAGRQMKRVIPRFSPNTPHIMIFPILHIDD